MARRTIQQLQLDYPIGARVRFDDGDESTNPLDGTVVEIDSDGVPVVRFSNGIRWTTSTVDEYPRWTLTVISQPATEMGRWNV